MTPRLQPRVASRARVQPPAGTAASARPAFRAPHCLLRTNPQKQNPGSEMWVREAWSGCGGAGTPCRAPWTPGPHRGSAPAPHPCWAACAGPSAPCVARPTPKGLALGDTRGRAPVSGGLRSPGPTGPWAHPGETSKGSAHQGQAPRSSVPGQGPAEEWAGPARPLRAPGAGRGLGLLLRHCTGTRLSRTVGTPTLTRARPRRGAGGALSLRPAGRSGGGQRR